MILGVSPGISLLGMRSAMACCSDTTTTLVAGLTQVKTYETWGEFVPGVQQRSPEGNLTYEIAIYIAGVSNHWFIVSTIKGSEAATIKQSWTDCFDVAESHIIPNLSSWIEQLQDYVETCTKIAQAVMDGAQQRQMELQEAQKKVLNHLKISNRDALKQCTGHIHLHLRRPSAMSKGGFLQAITYSEPARPAQLRI
jgi:hypothetical protein